MREVDLEARYGRAKDRARQIAWPPLRPEQTERLTLMLSGRDDPRIQEIVRAAGPLTSEQAAEIGALLGYRTGAPPVNGTFTPPAPPRLPEPAGPCYLYRYFDDCEPACLLYVGITDDPHSREDQHRRESPWHAVVAHRTVEEFESRIEAAEAEASAVRDENPAFNVLLRPSHAWVAAMAAYMATHRAGKP